MKTLFKKNVRVLAIALAAVLIVGFVLAANSTLKANEEPESEPTAEPVSEFVPESAPESAPEPASEPAAEPEPVWEDVPAEDTAAETADEQPAYDFGQMDPALVALIESAQDPADEQPQLPVVIEIPELPAQPEAEPETEPEVPEQEPEEAEEAEETAPAADRSVKIDYEFVDGRFTGLGCKITLKAVLKGYEDVQPTYQWQRRAPGGSWSNVPGATESTYTYAITADNYDYDWRVVVSA